MKGNFNNMQQSFYLSPLGCLKITHTENMVSHIEWFDQKHDLEKLDNNTITDWLDSYFSGHCSNECLFELKPVGTVFQQRVWYYMKKIPAGETLTYGDIAKLLGSSAQAVGNACRANPIVVMIPCHRVLSATGHGGYAGQTQGVMMQRKLGLLALELGVDPKKIYLDD